MSSRDTPCPYTPPSGNNLEHPYFLIQRCHEMEVQAETESWILVWSRLRC